MAFADFSITAKGAEWLAAAVEDAAQQTQEAKLDRIDFGAGGITGIDRVWKSCTDSLRVASAGQSVTISGIVSNEGDTTYHDLNRIEVWGHVGSDAPALMAWSLAEYDEEIPAATEQLITRRAVIQIALSGEASVSISGAMSGYASEDDILLTAPHHTRGDIILSNSADTAVVSLRAETEDAPDLAKLVVGGTGISTGGDVICRKLYADGADPMVTPQGYSAIGGSLVVSGTLEVNGSIGTTSGDLSVDGDIAAKTAHISGVANVSSLIATSGIVTGSGTVSGRNVTVAEKLSLIRLTNLDNNSWRLANGSGGVISSGTRDAVASFLASHTGYLFIGAANPGLVAQTGGTYLPTMMAAYCLFVGVGDSASVLSDRMAKLPDRFDGFGFNLRTLV